MSKSIRLHMNDYAALATLCFVIIVYQLALTKLLSVIAWYHYTFLTLSLVMFGLGAPGIWFTLCRNPLRFLPYLLLAGGISLVLSELFILHYAHTITDRFYHILSLILAILIPMLCLGGCVCLYLIKAEGPRFGRMYAADLLGACAGAALIVPLIDLVPVPKMIALLGCLVLVVLISNTRKLLLAAVIALVGTGLLLFSSDGLQLRHTKYDESIHGVIYEQWTPTTRITVFNHIFWVRHPERGFTWGPGRHVPARQIEQYWIEQDASAGTPLTKFDGDLSQLDYLLYDVTNAAHLLRPARSAAIIGGGGGRDILSALKAGIEDITVIELNQGMVDTVSSEFGAFVGDIYHRPGVHTVVAEGRSYLARTDRTFDLIQISLIDSWAASLAGAFALAENNLYTKEAYKAYFARLSPDGMVTTSRWKMWISNIEVMRLALLVYASLKEMDVSDPAAHIAIVEGDAIGNVIASKSPFSAKDRKTLQRIARDKGFTVAFPLPPSQHNHYTRLFSEAQPVLVEEYRRRGIDIVPPTDDRPFFFNSLRLFDLSAKVAEHNHQAVQVLRYAVGSVIVLAVIVFFLPFLLNRRMKLLPAGELGGSSLYFTLIGMGFMAMEIYMLHRFTLYMGHPSYSASAVLFCLLLGMAAGAFVSARCSIASFKRFVFLMPLYLLVVSQLMPYVFAATLFYAFPAKILMTAALLLPGAFLGGFFLPLGIERYGDAGKPWFWALNGSFGVFASVISLPVAMNWGYTTVIWIACLSYVIAGGILMLHKGRDDKAIQEAAPALAAP